MTIADTDVLIDFLSGTGPSAERIASEIERGSLSTTAISRFELLSGSRSSGKQAAVRELLSVMITLPLDEAAADKAAELRQDLEQTGQPIGMADSLIAGIVLSRGAVLLTRNRRHFEHISSLRLADVP